jgi:hypothetical protein
MDIISKDIIENKILLLKLIKKYEEFELVTIRTPDNKLQLKISLLDFLNEESLIYKTIINFKEQYLIIDIKCLEHEVCDRSNELANYYLNLLTEKNKTKSYKI